MTQHGFDCNLAARISEFVFPTAGTALFFSLRSSFLALQLPPQAPSDLRKQSQRVCSDKITLLAGAQVHLEHKHTHTHTIIILAHPTCQTVMSEYAPTSMRRGGVSAET